MRLYKANDGKRYLVSGGRKGISFPDGVQKIYGHTHPPVGHGELNVPSVADRQVLEQLNQSKQYIYHDGQRTTLYKSGDEVTITNY